jgi:uncharacterized protein (TIGR02284 family)
MATMQLPEKSIDWLQDLIQLNIDSRDGFQEAADDLQNKGGTLATVFRGFASQRANQARELQTLVSANAETPERDGSVAAAAHRTWMDLRSTLGGGDHAVLSEAERGEDHIKEKYEEAIKDLGPCSCTTILRSQYEAIRAAHDQVRDMRDHCKEANC